MFKNITRRHALKRGGNILAVAGALVAGGPSLAALDSPPKVKKLHPPRPINWERAFEGMRRIRKEYARRKRLGLPPPTWEEANEFHKRGWPE